MAPKTLAHHRKSDNMYRFTFGVQTITVTRRFLPSRAVRVRVTSSTWDGKGEGNWTEYRDFADMHEGDAAYSKQAVRFTEKWEERYLSTPAKKKEAAVSEPTQEPTHPATQDDDGQPTATQWAAGATMTPSKAAELATRRTGVRHVVADDGRTLCRRPATEPPATLTHTVPADAEVTLSRKGLEAVVRHQALVGKVVGRVLGEYTVNIPGRRLGRTDAMLILLKAMERQLKEADMATHALRSGVALTVEGAAHVADLQVRATYFRALRDAGYAQDTTWDELIDMLRPVISTALHGLEDQRAALERVNATGQRSIRRSIAAAEEFLNACAPVLSFFQDGDEDDD